MTVVRLTGLFLALLCAPALANQTLDSRMHHLRWGDAREWSDFPEQPESHDLTVKFEAKPNAAEQTIRVRHRDLKQFWSVKLNGKELGPLPRDENPMVTYWSVPAGLLKDGGNELRIACLAKVPAVPPAEGASDDVMIGEIELIDAPRKDVLSQSSAEVKVVDADSGKPLPCRLTIVDSGGCLVDLGNKSDEKSAVRPGVVYTVDGQAKIHLPAGTYTIYAGRGFAYGIDSATINLKANVPAAVNLKIRREVKLDGYVSSDTHIHTFTYSRHGDATLDERLITLAGEDIQLPIATDHNLVIDYASRAKELGVDRYLKPVIGEEVTTAKLGHFNVFPLTTDGPLPDWRAPSWKALGESLAKTPGDQKAPGYHVVILNHARDIHGGFRPFDPSRHLSRTGEDLDGWEVPAKAMEVINSGATQTDAMQLYRDWFGMLNHGKRLTPIGASDSHDVSRFIVGQGRTYVRSNAKVPADIGLPVVIDSFQHGRTLVSFGLVADITAEDGSAGPGDTVPAADVNKEKLEVTLRVLGPSWTHASHVTLFANGEPVFEEDIASPVGQPEPAGVKWQKKIELPWPQHRSWLVLVATGPGVTAPYWPIAKPYQPASPDWKSYVIGSSGPLWFEGAESRTASQIAQGIVKAADGDIRRAIAELKDADRVVAAQTAVLLRRQNPNGFVERVRPFLQDAPDAVKKGFKDLEDDLAESQAAREKQRK